MLSLLSSIRSESSPWCIDGKPITLDCEFLNLEENQFLKKKKNPKFEKNSSFFYDHWNSKFKKCDGKRFLQKQAILRKGMHKRFDKSPGTQEYTYRLLPPSLVVWAKLIFLLEIEPTER
jgi:hypothetical protein